ncbi:endonuclease/exonuclease/phosphatase family protein [Streptomyces sp. SAS_260]|uniref:endonuclease/exonuclease/phosphatase family protein n=1 Tax=Streptomyces sp. SAS_260 TaxID=3412751 RepID=UPI00403D119A
MTPTAHGEDVITVVSLNLQNDGGPDTPGQPFPQRWLDAHTKLLKPLRPDIVLRQEATYSHLDGQRRLHAAEDILEMTGVLTPNGAGRNPTALYLRPSTFPTHEVIYDRPGQRRMWRTPPTVVTTHLAEVPEVDITVASWHAAFNSPTGRQRETDELTSLVDKVKSGTAFLGGGDANEAPVAFGERTPSIDWTRPDITDFVHMVHRTVMCPDGTRANADYLDRTLLGCNLHDVARHAAHHLQQPDAMKPTAGHAPGAAGQGGPRRIDRIYADAWLAQAVLAVRVLDTPHISDHHAVCVVFDRPLFVDGLRRRFAPLTPIALTA